MIAIETAPRRFGDAQLGRRIQLLRAPRSRSDLVAAMNNVRRGDRSAYTIAWLKGIETGHRAISVDDLADVADVLGVSMDAIARGVDADSLASIVAPYEGRINEAGRDLLRRTLVTLARK